jgi:hypothetical protein
VATAVGRTIADLANVTPDELVSMWHVAADDAIAHQPCTCGHPTCPQRRAAIDECDAYAERWNTLHARSVTP